jgi:hypothetical protein
VIDYAALSSELGSMCTRGDHSDLPSALASARPPIPPFGQLFGLPIILDEAVSTGAAVLVSPVFGGNDFLELSLDEWSRVEAPRVASFASAGELPEETAPSHPEPAHAP